MAVQTVLVCETQVPLVQGGAELLVRQLVSELRQRGIAADRVSVPFKWYPKEEILPHAAAWRMLDLSESNGRAIDLVIATKFPTYFVRHPRKVCWLVHQHRAAYELCATEFSDFSHEEIDVGLRDRIMALDERMLGECHGLYTISQTVTARLEKYNGLPSTPLYHPPLIAPKLSSGSYGNYLLSVARLERNKRVDLVVRALAHLPAHLTLIVVGEGSHRRLIEREAMSLGIRDRITFAGAVSDDQLVALYRDALCLVYAPFDEDYGLATLEGFLAEKPVVTARDSGGTLEFVRDGENGFVVDPDPVAIADAVARIDANRGLAASFGKNGRDVATAISWDAVIDRLLSHG
ncbi:MAG TPA: glycosyltransferase family 4 protein [Vicinamibacterales bacterium]|nr:glycosyltransferase family 4 protein [Vicinamibacterales bacterium]